MSLARQYTDEIFAERGYWATWEPSVPLRLGVCGPVEDRIFRPEGDVGQFGIPFDVDYDPTPADTDYSSARGLDIEFQLKAGSQTIPNVPQGTAGARVRFTRQRAAVVAVKGGREHRIADQRQLRTDLLASARSDRPIPYGWFVVTHLVACASATVLVADSAGAEFTLSAQADFAAGPADLANAQLRTTINTIRNIGYKMLAQDGATPLFRGVRLKRSWWSGDVLETLGPAALDQLGDEPFEDLTPDTADVD